ncbi:trehalose-phosphatase [uncultured Microbacterium sp.]|uniref:Trehalose 6-phosphate phosphatase n=1 Tax=uncultured Microbacterium sp. TaxID=191216 RepID=A0A1Y5NVK8_9MICO|nr:trehalose-phosphatase [uncultured Microbacterium sp.]SBS70492.1 Trehalose-6-phosphatase [uncultured Microbacterium sp.]
MTLDADLAALARTATLLVALDFDGTLAPLQDEPMRSRMLPEARTALDRLAALPETAVALVSGRTLAHLEEISEHSADSRIHLAGSHGAEFWHPDDPGDDSAPEDTTLRDALTHRAEGIVEPLEGAWIEPKIFGFGLHTRLAADADAVAATTAIDALVAEEAPTWRRRVGQDILEFASRQEGKDSAVRALRDRVGATAVLFAGDDVTDEDALAALEPQDLGIRVGAGETAARQRVPDAAALAAALTRLAELRGAR